MSDFGFVVRIVSDYFIILGALNVAMPMPCVGHLIRHEIFSLSNGLQLVLIWLEWSVRSKFTHLIS